MVFTLLASRVKNESFSSSGSDHVSLMASSPSVSKTLTQEKWIQKFLMKVLEVTSYETKDVL